MFGWILIEGIIKRIELRAGEERGSFREESGCVDQVSSLKEIEEECWEREKLFVAFMDWERPYDMVDRESCEKYWMSVK